MGHKVINMTEFALIDLKSTFVGILVFDNVNHLLQVSLGLLGCSHNPGAMIEPIMDTVILFYKIERLVRPAV